MFNINANLFSIEFPWSIWLIYSAIFTIFIIGDLCLAHKFNSIEKVAVFWMSASVCLLVSICIISPRHALDSVTAYVIEFTLSCDNLFLMYMIFQSFNIENKSHQHTILAIGLVSAVILRLLFIAIGIDLIERFTWLLPACGLILIYSGVKVLLTKNKQHKDQSLASNNAGNDGVIQASKSILGIKIIDLSRMSDVDAVHDLNTAQNKVLEQKEGESQHNRQKISWLIFNKGKFLGISSALAALIFIEKMDIVLAIDSIPAIVSITKEPFIVFFCNVLSLMGLRSLYLILEKYMSKLSFITTSIGIILLFIGFKMSISFFDIHIPEIFALIVPISAIAIPGWFYKKALKH